MNNMKHQSRQDLKERFSAGKRPSADDFGLLIDSMLNLNDERFNRTPDDGLCITSQGDSGTLLSFYDPNPTGYLAEWTMGFGSKSDRLALRRPAPPPGAGQQAPPPLLILDARMANSSRVGVNTDNPQAELHVEGDLQSRGRRGASFSVPANGEFQPVTELLTGCQVFEVVAGVGLPGTGRFALIHAIAMNAFNPTWRDSFPFFKRPIRTQHAFYTRRADRLQLRWMPVQGDPSWGHGKTGQYQLQVRTRSTYDDEAAKSDASKKGDDKGVRVTGYITRLWFNAFDERNDGA